jgi:hypothetical protein
MTQIESETLRILETELYYYKVSLISVFLPTKVFFIFWFNWSIKINLVLDSKFSFCYRCWKFGSMGSPNTKWQQNYSIMNWVKNCIEMLFIIAFIAFIVKFIEQNIKSSSISHEMSMISIKISRISCISIILFFLAIFPLNSFIFEYYDNYCNNFHTFVLLYLNL